MLPIAITAIAVALFIGWRFVAPLRVRAAIGMWWIVFAPMAYVTTLVLVLAMPSLLAGSWPTALLVGGLAVLLVGVTLGTAYRMRTRLRGATTRDQVGSALFEVMIEPILVYFGCILLITVLGLVLLVTWIILNGGRV